MPKTFCGRITTNQGLANMLSTNLPSTHQISDPEKWVDLHGDHMFRYALMRLRNRDLAEEVVQETFVAALQAKDRFSGQSSERTWLIGILKHKVIDHFRRSSREVLEENLETSAEQEELFRTTGEWVNHWNIEPMEWGQDPSRMVEQQEFREALDRCLATLPRRLAQVFILREMEEMSTEEICEALGITSTNLWVMLHRARMQLRRSLELSYFGKNTALTGKTVGR